MNSPANDLNLLRKLYSEQNWPQLTQAAAAISGRQPQNGEALRYLGIGELMTMRGGPDKLLRASLLNDNEAGLWLAVLQEFSAHPPASVAPGDLPAQVEFSKLRRSPYMDYPQEVHIETLAICNAACTFCPYPHMDRQGDRMPDELIDKIIDDLRKVPTNFPSAPRSMPCSRTRSCVCSPTDRRSPRRSSRTPPRFATSPICGSR